MTVTFTFHVELVNYCFETKNVTLNVYFYPFHGFFNPRYIHARVLMITSEKREKNKTKKTKQNKKTNKTKAKTKAKSETKQKKRIIIIQISLSKKICSNG